MAIQKKCKKCGSTDLVIIIRFTQDAKDYLYCGSCSALLKRLTKKETEAYREKGIIAV